VFIRAPGDAGWRSSTTTRSGCPAVVRRRVRLDAVDIHLDDPDHDRLARSIAERVAARGGRARYVGGAVRDHVLGRRISDEGDIFAAEQDLLNQANAGESASAEELALPFEALGSSATFDRVLFDGAEFGHAGEVHVGSEE
jgi:hypothetical protein